MAQLLQSLCTGAGTATGYTGADTAPPGPLSSRDRLSHQAKLICLTVLAWITARPEASSHALLIVPSSTADSSQGTDAWA